MPSITFTEENLEKWDKILYAENRHEYSCEYDSKLSEIWTLFKIKNYMNDHISKHGMKKMQKYIYDKT